MLVIAFRYLSGFAFVLIETHWDKQFGFIPLPGMLEVVLGVSSLNCDNMSYPIWVACKEGNKSISRNYFKKVT
jgi:hypothetical protein